MTAADLIDIFRGAHRMPGISVVHQRPNARYMRNSKRPLNQRQRRKRERQLRGGGK